MYNIIVTTHGGMAQGIKDTLNMILGEQSSVDFVSFTPEDTVDQFEERLKDSFAKVSEDKRVLFLTDLFGGTPNNISAKIALSNPGRARIISGISFPLVIEAVMNSTQELDNVVNQIIEGGVQGVVEMPLNSSSDDEDDE